MVREVHQPDPVAVRGGHTRPGAVTLLNRFEQGDFVHPMP